jgi:hypothetical protein
MKLYSGAVSLAAILVTAAAPSAAKPDLARGIAELQGVWTTQIRILDCSNDAVLAGPIPALISFNQGGTASETGPSTPMLVRGPALGTWHRLGRDTFEARFIFQRFDPGGFLIGTQTIRGHIQVASDGRTYVARGSFALNDLLGQQVGGGCSRVDGTRF